MASLYPTFNLPSIVTNDREAREKRYKPAPMFDYNSGGLVRDGANRLVLASGREAYMQWCLKMCVTERGTKLAYSDRVGVEILKAAKEHSDPEAIESAIERTIIEALMVHPATEYVRHFVFRWDGSESLHVEFCVKGKEWEEETLHVDY